VIEAVRPLGEGLGSASLPEQSVAVNAVLEQLDAGTERIRSLPGWNWIQDNLDHRSVLPESAACKASYHQGHSRGHAGSCAQRAARRAIPLRRSITGSATGPAGLRPVPDEPGRRS
jgi:hypothetical protein